MCFFFDFCRHLLARMHTFEAISDRSPKPIDHDPWIMTSKKSADLLSQMYSYKKYVNIKKHKCAFG